MMKRNVGGWDRGLRILAGLILITLAATGVISPWGWLGLVLVFTGLLRFCPLYPLLGINRCTVDRR